MIKDATGVALTRAIYGQRKTSTKWKRAAKAASARPDISAITNPPAILEKENATEPQKSGVTDISASLMNTSIGETSKI